MPKDIGNKEEQKFCSIWLILHLLKSAFFYILVYVKTAVLAAKSREAGINLHRNSDPFNVQGVAYAKLQMVQDSRRRGASRAVRLEFEPTEFAGGRQTRQNSYFVHQ